MKSCLLLVLPADSVPGQSQHSEAWRHREVPAWYAAHQVPVQMELDQSGITSQGQSVAPTQGNPARLDHQFSNGGAATTGRNDVQPLAGQVTNLLITTDE